MAVSAVTARLPVQISSMRRWGTLVNFATLEQLGTDHGFCKSSILRGQVRIKFAPHSQRSMVHHLTQATDICHDHRPRIHANQALRHR